jgi:hydroxymethylpyrimidine pyrophosphatase-like HAD family hydrolase/energy-coupling factor transporter ATP-binding protein EcfA2
MRYFCLTCDYDGTIARHGQVAPSTVEALKRVRASGRKIVLATGRELNDLRSVFPELTLFDRIVGENGALVYNPVTQKARLLADRPPAQFVNELRRRGVQPLSVGECIVATWHPFETTILDVIREQGLELQVIFNKDAVMVLPSGVNKATGLKCALSDLQLSPHNTVGVGDAENDHVFLSLCECSVAVANALPALKQRADFVTSASHGQGVEELIEMLLADDLASLAPRLTRHSIFLGHTQGSREFSLDPYESRLTVAGPSGSGKSTTVAAIVERLVEHQYQVCLFDPEGDYDEFERFVTLGGPQRVPGVSEILEVLNTVEHSLSINLLGVPLADRPGMFLSLLARIQELRAKTGRPHWIIIDEAHHLLPATLESASLTVPKELFSFALVSVHPDQVARAVLSSCNTLIAVGSSPEAVIQQFSAASGFSLQFPAQVESPAQTGEVMVWQFADGSAPVLVKIEPAKAELRRHHRKYAAGELGKDKSFYFRGPEGKLNLRAQNMEMFAQIAEGVDEQTWLHHLRNSHYSQWLRDAVKDSAIASEVASIEQNDRLPAMESRAQILEAIRKHYTAPA